MVIEILEFKYKNLKKSQFSAPGGTHKYFGNKSKILPWPISKIYDVAGHLNSFCC